MWPELVFFFENLSWSRALILAVISRLFGGTNSTAQLDELTDEDLMERFAAGDHRAFELLLRRNQQALFAFVFRYLGHRDQAEELVQDVFFRVCRVAPEYSRKAKFRTWLFTIARNACIDALRRRSNRPMLSIDQPCRSEDERSPAELLTNPSQRDARSQLLRSEFRAQLEAAIDALPDEQREVFCMREFSSLKFREIADITEVSENTIKSRMRYALESLRARLSEYQDCSFDGDDQAQFALQGPYKASS
jgi:RNA polymerase sigma-70 factor (ECF subfamily)